MLSADNIRPGQAFEKIQKLRARQSAKDRATVVGPIGPKYRFPHTDQRTQYSSGVEWLPPPNTRYRTYLPEKNANFATQIRPIICKTAPTAHQEGRARLQTYVPFGSGIAWSRFCCQQTTSEVGLPAEQFRTRICIHASKWRAGPRAICCLQTTNLA